MDLRRLSSIQLERLIDQASKRRQQLAGRGAWKVKEEVMRLVRKAGLTLQEVLQAEQPDAAFRKGPNAVATQEKHDARKAAIATGAATVDGMLYRDPNPPHFLWNGHGARPKWFLALLAKGKKATDLIAGPEYAGKWKPFAEQKRDADRAAADAAGTSDNAKAKSAANARAAKAAKAEAAKEAEAAKAKPKGPKAKPSKKANGKQDHVLDVKAVKGQRYVNPKDRKQVWSGTGTRPQWWLEAIRSGKTEKELRVRVAIGRTAPASSGSEAVH